MQEQYEAGVGSRPGTLQPPTLSPGTQQSRGNDVAGSLFKKALRVGVYVLACVCLLLAMFVKRPMANSLLRTVTPSERASELEASNFQAPLGEPDVLRTVTPSERASEFEASDSQAPLSEPDDVTCWCNYDMLRGGLEPFQWALTNETTRRQGTDYRVFRIQARHVHV